MSEENVEVVRRYFEAYDRGDIDEFGLALRLIAAGVDLADRVTPE